MENNKLKKCVKKFAGNIGIAFAVAAGLLGCINMILSLYAATSMETESIKVLFIVSSASSITLLCFASFLGFFTLWIRLIKIEKKLLEK